MVWYGMVGDYHTSERYRVKNRVCDVILTVKSFSDIVKEKSEYVMLLNCRMVPLKQELDEITSKVASDEADIANQKKAIADEEKALLDAYQKGMEKIKKYEEVHKLETQVAEIKATNFVIDENKV
jgi:hypothetical protein